MNKLLLVVLSTLAFTLSGCLYKADVHQGNILAAESVQQLKTGMTRNEVRALLGSPLISDSFHTNRWDYYSYSKVGKKRLENVSRLSLTFSANKLITITTN